MDHDRGLSFLSFDWGKRMKRRIAAALFIAVIAGWGGEAAAQQPYYIGVNGLYSRIGGDFNGKDGPDAEPGKGAGFVFGLQLTPAAAFQITLNRLHHKAELTTGVQKSDAIANEMFLGLKYRFLPLQTIRPFLEASYGFISFVMKDTPEGRVKFTGRGLDLGIGADYHFSESFSVGLAVHRKLLGFDAIRKYNAIEDEVTTEDLTPNADGVSTAMSLGFIYHFQP